MNDTLKSIIKLIPFPCITACIVLLFKNSFFGVLFLFGLIWWITIPLTLLSIILFFKSIKLKNRWQQVIVVWGVLNLILFIVSLNHITQQEESCNPDIMATHYEQHHAKMDELHKYIQNAVGECSSIQLEFNDTNLYRFLANPDTSTQYFFNSWSSYDDTDKDTLMQIAGLTATEFDSIYTHLKAINCLGFSYSWRNPEKIEFYFHRVRAAIYIYEIYNRPMTDAEKNNALESLALIPYTERCVFKFHGGTAGANNFHPKMREDFLEKHNIGNYINAF